MIANPSEPYQSTISALAVYLEKSLKARRACPRSFRINIKDAKVNQTLKDIYAEYLAGKEDQDIEALAERLAESSKAVKPVGHQFLLSSLLASKIKARVDPLHGVYADPMTAEVRFETDLSASLASLTHLGAMEQARMESALNDDLLYFPAYIRILLAPTSLWHLRKYREQARSEIDPELAVEIKRRGYGSVLDLIQNERN